MRRILSVRALRGGLLAAMLGLAGCAGDSGPPRDIENACAIFRDRPGWAKAIAAAERRWGRRAPVMLATIWRESRFRPDARPPKTYFLGVVPTGRKSSAYGYSQAIDGTWDWYRQSTGNRGADRDDFDDAADFVGWYMDRTARVNGVAKTDAYNQYLAYHEGHTGYSRGSYRAKSWLLGAAGEVRSMAARYEGQLRGCPGVYAMTTAGASPT